MLQITPVSAFKDNYIWVLRNAITSDCVVVDPGDALPILHYLAAEQLRLRAILLTHHHADHCGGVPALLERFKAPVYGPAHEKIMGITHAVTQQDTIALPELNLHLKVLAVPGHTAGHVAYYGQQVLFCGDTLFLAGCGRLFEGTAEQMYRSLCTLASLPDDTQIYCGHEYTLANLAFAAVVEPDNEMITKRIKQVQAQRRAGCASAPDSLAIEKATNPFLRCHVDTVRQAAEKFAGKPLKEFAEVLQIIRQWKDNFTS